MHGEQVGGGAQSLGTATPRGVGPIEESWIRLRGADGLADRGREPYRCGLDDVRIRRRAYTGRPPWGQDRPDVRGNSGQHRVMVRDRSESARAVVETHVRGLACLLELARGSFHQLAVRGAAHS